ncbi:MULTISPECIES: hypothetical protein [unclassified Thiomonas]|uniref:hypothetical protein n=1 Tax=unclassified Thiomonas TaxID=2625466 RepID=UPI0004DBB462|nr:MULTISPECIES: hypothetical protein [unclassified Thiomonas]CDW96334.1 conserved hypothetical protein [Thiomonas sp. CB2]VDY06738.1 conserved protein of unknown function [Thiomonas sp. Bio17B3]VDY09968.1 conserved protein of unknown function [Thiomonas sp. Sup16B3]VDY11211.1 conserved protein of unknown function [Thiomonas sp. Sup16B3]VDY11250.1 conserved protein of unknown function [Thiomonas sp. Bio17B3]
MNDLLTLLHAADKLDSGRWLMRCPAHRGALASSLEVTLEAGRYHLVCMCGCAPDQILEAARRAISRPRE